MTKPPGTGSIHNLCCTFTTYHDSLHIDQILAEDNGTDQLIHLRKSTDQSVNDDNGSILIPSPLRIIFLIRLLFMKYTSANQPALARFTTRKDTSNKVNTKEPSKALILKCTRRGLLGITRSDILHVMGTSSAQPNSFWLKLSQHLLDLFSLGRNWGRGRSSNHGSFGERRGSIVHTISFNTSDSEDMSSGAKSRTSSNSSTVRSLSFSARSRLSVERLTMANNPQHWHDICPEPIQDTLDRMEIQRQDAIYEMYQTERCFIDDMQSIIDVSLTVVFFSQNHSHTLPT